MFMRHAVFEAFEGLLEAPALVIEVAEGGRRIAVSSRLVMSTRTFPAGEICRISRTVCWVAAHS